MLEIVDMLERIHTFPGMLHVLESRVKCFNPFSFGVFHFRNRWRLVRCYLNYLGRSLSGVLKGLNVPAEKRSDRKYEFVRYWIFGKLIVSQEVDDDRRGEMEKQRGTSNSGSLDRFCFRLFLSLGSENRSNRAEWFCHTERSGRFELGGFIRHTHSGFRQELPIFSRKDRENGTGNGGF